MITFKLKWLILPLLVVIAMLGLFLWARQIQNSNTAQIEANFLFLTNQFHPAITNYMEFSTRNKKAGEDWVNSNSPTCIVHIRNTRPGKIMVLPFVSTQSKEQRWFDAPVLEAKMKGNGFLSIGIDPGAETNLTVPVLHFEGMPAKLMFQYQHLETALSRKFDFYFQLFGRKTKSDGMEEFVVEIKDETP